MPASDVTESWIESDEAQEAARQGKPERSWRRLFRHWKAAIGIACLVLSIIELLKAPINEALQLRAHGVTTVIVLFPGLIALALWTRERFSVVSLLKDPGEVDKILARNAGRLGRADDIDQIISIFDNCPVVHLTGESGVGKSSLLKFGLKDKLLTSNRYLPIYVDNLGRDWDASEEQILLSIAGSLPGAPKAGRSLFVCLDAMLATGRSPVLMFDEFNGYISTHRNQLVNPENGTWLSFAGLCQRNRFWERLFQAAAERRIYLIFAARSDEADGLHAFTGDSHESRRLSRLARAEFNMIARSIDAAVHWPENGWTELSDRLMDDLAGSVAGARNAGVGTPGGVGYILPIEAYLSLTGLKTMRTLSVREYYKLGRIEGLIGRKIRLDINDAAAGTSIDDDVLAHALAAMSEPPHDRLLWKSVGELQRELTPLGLRVDPDALEKGLLELQRRRIVRRRVRVGGTETAWSLYHGYIGRGIARLLERERTAQQQLDSAFEEFQKAKGLWRIRRLLSPYSLTRTLTHRLRGRVHLRGKRTYVAWSTLRFAPYLLVLAAPLFFADAGVRGPGMGTMRRWIDERGVSILRRPDPTGMIASVRTLESRTRQWLEDRRTTEGWFNGTEGTAYMRDLWAHAQAHAALLANDGTSETAVRALSSLRPMFSSDWLATDDERPVGWCQTWYPEPRTPKQLQEMTTESFPRGEILFWTASSVFGLAGCCATDARPEVDIWIHQLETMMPRYWGAEAGSDGWNRYINQANGLGDHSVYVSVLAVSALLEAADAQVHFQVAGLDRDVLIRRTCAWIWSARLSHDGLQGWGDEDRRDLLALDGLTYQTYSTLIRAMDRGKWEGNSDVTSACIAFLQSRSEQESMPESVSRRIQSFTNTFNQPKKVEYPLTFLNYPWQVECLARVLEYGNNQPRAVPTAHLRWCMSRLSTLVCNRGAAEIQRVVDAEPYTYRRAECLLVMARVRQILQRIAPSPVSTTTDRAK